MSRGDIFAYYCHADYGQSADQAYKCRASYIDCKSDDNGFDPDILNEMRKIEFHFIVGIEL